MLPTTPHTRRRWFQFGLQSLLGAVTIGALVIGVIAYNLKRRNEHWYRLSSRVDVSIENQPISYAIDQLANTVDVPIYMDRGVSLEKLDSIEINGIAARSALTLLLEPRGLEYRVTGSGIRVRNKAQ